MRSISLAISTARADNGTRNASFRNLRSLELRADFTVDDPQKEHLELNGLHDAIPLASYERGRAGDRMTVELFVNLDHGFVCVRAPTDPPAPPRTPRRFRQKVVEHLSKRALLGDLADVHFVMLCLQVLKIGPEPEETP